MPQDRQPDTPAPAAQGAAALLRALIGSTEAAGIERRSAIAKTR